MYATYEDIGARIQEKRKERGFTQEKVAEYANISVAHLSHIENAKTIPSLSVIINIINFLQATPNEIFCGTVETAKPELLKETEILFDSCDSKQMVKLNKHIKSFIELTREED